MVVATDQAREKNGAEVRRNPKPKHATCGEEEVHAPSRASARSRDRQTSPDAVGGGDASAKGGEDQEQRAAIPVTAGLSAEGILGAELRARREAEERRVENVQDTAILETSRLFDDTATTCYSRSVVVVLVAAVVICAFILLASLWDESWDISGVGAILIVCAVIFALLNFVLVMCWWFNCSFMKGKRFVCTRNSDYSEPVKLYEDQP